MTMLDIRNVHAFYGHIHALKDVTLAVDKGEIVTLIGGNGAGKSTLLKTASGLIKPRDGSIILEGREITAHPPHEIVTYGVVQVPEGRRVFGRLTVTENLDMGAFNRTDKSEVSRDIERIFVLFPRLKERRRQLAGTLSGGEQQMLALGRALMARPRVLLLDEPSMGLAPVIVDLIFDTIRRLHEEGTTMLLVEQNARMALQVANRGYVLQSGAVILSDSAENLRKNDLVRKAYLGEI